MKELQKIKVDFVKELSVLLKMYYLVPSQDPWSGAKYDALFIYMIIKSLIANNLHCLLLSAYFE